MKKRLTFALKCLVSLGLLGYLFHRTDLSRLWATFCSVSCGPLLAGLVFHFLFQGASILRWAVVGRALGLDFPPRLYARLYLIGVYFNTFLPGLLGGDLVRIFYLVRDGAGKTGASLSILYDRGFGLLAAAFLILVSLPACGAFLPPAARESLVWLCAGLLAGAGLLALLGHRWRERFSHEFLRLSAGVARPDRFPVLFLLGLLVQVLYALHVLFLARSLGVEADWWTFFLIVPLVGILASLPVSLGGFGVREGTLSYLLGLLGYGTEIGVALGFLMYGAYLLVGLVGLVLYLRRPGREGELPQEGAEGLPGGGARGGRSRSRAASGRGEKASPRVWV